MTTKTSTELLRVADKLMLTANQIDPADTTPGAQNLAATLMGLAGMCYFTARHPLIAPFEEPTKMLADADGILAQAKALLR